MNLRIISTKVHGYLDYITATVLPIVPRVFGWDRTVTRLHDTIASVTAGQSLMTNYELGVIKAIPMRTHLNLDAMAGCLLLGAAAVMDDEPTVVRGAIAGVGLYYLATVVMTQSRTEKEQTQEIEERYAEGRRVSEASYGTETRPEMAVEEISGIIAAAERF